MGSFFDHLIVSRTTLLFLRLSKSEAKTKTSTNTTSALTTSASTNPEICCNTQSLRSSTKRPVTNFHKMATYQLTVHDLFSRLAKDQPRPTSSSSSSSTTDNKTFSTTTTTNNHRSESISSYFSTSDESEVDFTDYNWRAHEAFEGVMREKGKQRWKKVLRGGGVGDGRYWEYSRPTPGRLNSIEFYQHKAIEHQHRTKSFTTTWRRREPRERGVRSKTYTKKAGGMPIQKSFTNYLWRRQNQNNGYQSA